MARIDFTKLTNELRQEINTSFNRRFPKEKREELKEKVLTNLKETRLEVENRARVLAERSKESPIVLNYLRPLVGSQRTSEVLASLETKVTSVRPVLRKIQSLRQQFLDLTAPSAEVTENEDTPKKKRKSKTKSEKSHQD